MIYVYYSAWTLRQPRQGGDSSLQAHSKLACSKQPRSRQLRTMQPSTLLCCGQQHRFRGPCWHGLQEGLLGGRGHGQARAAGAARICLKPLLSFPKAPPPLPGAGPALVSLAKLYVECVGLRSHLPNVASIFWGWRVRQSQHCLQCLTSSIPLLW